MANANNISIDPVNVFWQIEAEDLIDFTGLTGLDVKGKSFNISTAKDAILNYVWGDDAIAADPAVAGRVGIAFTVVGDTDTATTLAASCASALDALPGYVATSSLGIVTVKRAAIGVVTLMADTDMAVVLTPVRTGKDFDLGYLEGDIELSAAPSNFIVKSHQTGVTPLASLYQGIESIEMTTNMMETISSNLKEIYTFYGGSFTPAGGTTEIYGIGTNKQGNNLLIDAARLILRPVNAANNLTDTVLMLAVPVPGSLIFSGENTKNLSISWNGFADTSSESNTANIVAFGDVFQ